MSVFNHYVRIYVISITNDKYYIPYIFSLPKLLCSNHVTRKRQKKEVGNLYKKLAELLGRNSVLLIMMND